MSPAPDAEAVCCEICFESLFEAGRALVFPCDDTGRVDLDALPPRARCNYFYARTLVGRDYAPPRIACVAATAWASSVAHRLKPALLAVDSTSG